MIIGRHTDDIVTTIRRNCVSQVRQEPLKHSKRQKETETEVEGSVPNRNLH